MNDDQKKELLMDHVVEGEEAEGVKLLDFLL